MVEALLLIFVSSEDIRGNKISDAVIRFIHGNLFILNIWFLANIHIIICPSIYIPDFLKVRVGDQIERLANINEYVSNFCAQKARKHTK